MHMTATVELTLTDSVNALNEMVRQKKLVEGVRRFYADDTAMIESSSESTNGRDANVNREQAFESGLTRWDATLRSSVVDEKQGLAFNRWRIEFDHKEFGSGILDQIAVQEWRDGRIVRESFYKL
jgi:hypothetical protein